MLTTYAVENGIARAREGMPNRSDMLRGAVWIDLLDPSAAEVHAVQAALRVEVPTPEKMQEIEASSRLFREGDVLFLTANVLHGVETGTYVSTAITFMLTPGSLVTVRYATPKAFTTFATRSVRAPMLLVSPDAAMLHLFEQMVDRLADVLERVGADMDQASQAVFHTARAKAKATAKDANLRDTLIILGQVGEVTTRASETLLGLSRILTFVGAEKATAVRRENQALIKTLMRDVRSLVEHAKFLNDKAQFLLDAVLGIINVEQNAIIKTFTVAAVALMPPILIASVYGMNFDHLPELASTLGYPLSLLLMALSAVLPVWWFRRKGWL